MATEAKARRDDVNCMVEIVDEELVRARSGIKKWLFEQKAEC